MTDSSTINQFPKTGLINDIAIELGVEPAFIEKDWYAVQAIKTIANYSYGDLKAVFAGGTSLSKGYDLIQRFSEDIDFRIDASKNPNRNKRRKFRMELIELINSIEGLNIDQNSIISNYESKFFSFNIEYTQMTAQHSALRPYLKLEMTFNKILQTPEQRFISPIINKFRAKQPTITIDCITPIETAADKLSALCWRLEVEDSNNPDPTLMRHLYDLCALQDTIIDNKDFAKLVNHSVQADAGRRGSNENLNLKDKLALVVNKLESDSIYAQNYDDFVRTMFYGSQKEKIEFNKALQGFKEITSFLLNNNISVE